MKAIKILSPGKAALITDAPVPSLPSPDWVLIKTVAIALNPTDWKHIEYGAPATVGCDFAGTVVSAGASTASRFKPGDHVFGAVHGSNKLKPDTAAFAEYVATKAATLAHIPDHLSYEAAASMPVGILTVGQGLYQAMGLPWPDKPLATKVPILIWGGSSATGALGIQFAKLSGFEVISTCSKSNFEYVKSLGADVVFDSRSPTTGADIRAYTQNKLYYAWDTIGEHGSPQACMDALASSAVEGQKIRYGTISAAPGWEPPRSDVVYTMTVGYTAWGEAIDTQGWVFPAQPDHLTFITKWIVFVEGLLKEKKIRPHRLEVREGGFEKILSGLEDMKNGKISGVKVVYHVADP